VLGAGDLSFAQTAHNSWKESAPGGGHYRTLSLLSPKPDPSRAWMDTIIYPPRENTTGILAATKLRTIYLIEDVPSLLTLTPPPANSSIQTRAELDYMLDLQAKRTPVEVDKYKRLASIFHSPNNFNPYDPDYDRNFSSLFHVGSPLGKWYTYKNLPVTAQFLSDVYRDATYYFFKLKLAINRPRPYMLEPGLKNLERPPHPSYPSGHSAASYINAYVMSEIVPELATEFLKMAAEMAYSREVIGVHYPSDSEVSRLWARQFVNELFKKDKFRQDFEQAKKEVLAKQKSGSSKKEASCSSEDSCGGCGGCSSSDSCCGN
ncbi:MAG: phosphatase PAP2 family protein, partial [Chitinophagaceae bacterium]|nr:phosphatase PAP2 family protein [Chitinophagaceae bacterium]